MQFFLQLWHKAVLVLKYEFTDHILATVQKIISDFQFYLFFYILGSLVSMYDMFWSTNSENVCSDAEY